MEISGEGNQEFSFIVVIFEKCFRYLNIDVKEAVGHKTLSLGLETNLEVINYCK